jgi:hypothetical protein
MDMMVGWRNADEIGSESLCCGGENATAWVDEAE